MSETELPLGFGMALAGQPEAMKEFAKMTDLQKSQVLSRIHDIKSKEEMQSFVAGLAKQNSWRNTNT